MMDTIRYNGKDARWQSNRRTHWFFRFQKYTTPSLVEKAKIGWHPFGLLVSNTGRVLRYEIPDGTDLSIFELAHTLRIIREQLEI